MSDVFTGTVGLEHRLTFQDQDENAIDLTGKTLSVRVRKPDGEILVYADDAVERISAAEGTAKVETGTEDLDIPGTYKLQGFAVEGENTFPSDIVTFVVQRSLPSA